MSVTIRSSGALRALRVAVVAMLSILGLFTSRPATAQAASCYVATGAAAHILCWLDLSSYAGTVGTAQTIPFTLPDGSTLNLTLTNVGTTGAVTVTVPTYTGSALGNTSYTGILGSPSIYGGGTVPVKISGLTLKSPQGYVAPIARIFGADAETLDTGDGTAATASLQWATTGTNLVQAQLMNSTAGAPTPVCTLTGVGTQNAICVPSAPGNNAAYILSSDITPSQSFTMTYTSAAKQGYAYAVNLASLNATKSVTSRFSATDQFNVSVSRGASALATATTSGTGTTATTGNVVVMPTDTYTFSESAAGTTNLAQYGATYACVNAVTSSTVMPSGTGTSFTFTPAVDDQVTCTFTNVGPSPNLTVVPVIPTADVVVGSTNTDTFVLTNTGNLAGTFVVTASSLLYGKGVTPAISGYVFNSTTYGTLASLNTAIAAAGTTAVGGSISVGITYVASPKSTDTNTLTLSSDIVSGAATSSVVTGTEVDTSQSGVITVTKTGPATAFAGRTITYSVLVSFSGTGVVLAPSFSDSAPSGITFTTATCVPNGTATCGAVVATPTSVTSTITSISAGSSVTFTINGLTSVLGPVTNLATVTSATKGVPNASGSATTNVIIAPVTFGKTVQNLTSGTAVGTANTALPGDSLQYALNFTNSSGVTLHGISLSDQLPSRVTFVSASCGTLPAGVTCITPSPNALGLIVFSYSGSLAPSVALSAVVVVKVI